ncbi:hypothetical protein Tco_0378313 [Tanacetum coccineum]
MWGYELTLSSDNPNIAKSMLGDGSIVDDWVDNCFGEIGCVLCECLNLIEGTLSLKKILEAKNPTDMLTKVVTTEKLKLYAALTGLRDK